MRARVRRHGKRSTRHEPDIIIVMYAGLHNVPVPTSYAGAQRRILDRSSRMTDCQAFPNIPGLLLICPGPRVNGGLALQECLKSYVCPPAKLIGCPLSGS